MSNHSMRAMGLLGVVQTTDDGDRTFPVIVGTDCGENIAVLIFATREAAMESCNRLAAFLLNESEHPDSVLKTSIQMDAGL